MAKIHQLSPQQQHKLHNEKCGNGQGDIKAHVETTSAQDEADDANPANIQLQEAMELWKVAKKLGVTGGPAQGKIIDNIRAMEERDKKEAERLGNRSSTP